MATSSRNCSSFAFLTSFRASEYSDSKPGTPNMLRMMPNGPITATAIAGKALKYGRSLSVLWLTLFAGYGLQILNLAVRKDQRLASEDLAGLH